MALVYDPKTGQMTESDPLPEIALTQPIDTAVPAPEIQNIEATLLPERIVSDPAQVAPMAMPLPEKQAVPMEDTSSWTDHFTTDKYLDQSIQDLVELGGYSAPTDAQGVPLAQPEIPVAAGNADVFTPSATMMRTKTGTDQRTQTEATPGMNNALAGERAAVMQATKAADDSVKIATDLAILKEGADKERAAVSDAISADADQLWKDSKIAAEDSRQQVQKLREELATQPWTSYWGSKSNGDRIMLGLAVGLGALGQAQVGGQNVAMALVSNMVDDYNKNEDARVRSLESQLTLAQNYSTQAQQAIKDQYTLLAAKKAANFDKITGQLDAISAKTNTAKAANAASALSAQIKQKANNELLDSEEKLAAKNVMTRDVFVNTGINLDPTRFVKADGTEMSDSQSREYKAVINMAPSIKIMEDIEKGGYTRTNGYAMARNAFENANLETGMLGQVKDSVTALAKLESDMYRLTAGDQNAQRYFRHALDMLKVKLRTESGASISPTEYGKEMLSYLPRGNNANADWSSQDRDLKDARELRRRTLTASRGASQSGTKFWFETPVAAQGAFDVTK